MRKELDLGPVQRGRQRLLSELVTQKSLHVTLGRPGGDLSLLSMRCCGAIQMDVASRHC